MLKLPGALARFISTAGGIGYWPCCPGTWGTVPGVLLFFSVDRLLSLLANPPLHIPLHLILFISLLLLTFKATAQALDFFSGSDPSQVVIDEIAGVWLALLILRLFLAAPLELFIYPLAFLLFRLFDIVKPPPVYQLQALPGSVGVIFDDLFAGILAAALLLILFVVF